MAVKYVINDETMTQIADPLRSLTGRTDGMTPAEMAAAGAAAHTEVQTQTDLIYQIKTVLNGKAAGGTGKPEQEKTANITENGEHEIVPDEGYTLSKVSVNVNVESSVDTEIEDAMAARTLTEYRNDRLTTIGNYAFCGCSNLAEVYFPNVVTVGQNAFEGCKITEITPNNFPNLTTLNQHSFRACQLVTHVNLPKVTAVAQYAFNTSQYIKEVRFDKATSTGNRSFVANYRLEKAILPSLKSMAGLTFYQCYSLKAVILASETMCTLGNKDAFNQCYHILGTVNGTWNPNGDKDGYIYVPAALVDTYKAATNWSTYADQIRAIEDYPEITGG